MRKIGFVGILSSALMLGAVAGVMAPAALTLAASTTTTNHVWVATTASASPHSAARLTTSSGYTSGSFKVHVTGVTKGQVVTAKLVARLSTGKLAIIARRTITIATTKGHATFTVTLTKAEAKRIKTDLGASDKLELVVRIGTDRMVAMFAAA